jgi:hypothetical protein
MTASPWLSQSGRAKWPGSWKSAVVIAALLAYCCGRNIGESRTIPIYRLEEISEYSANISASLTTGFSKCDSVCLDGEGYLFVADSGWNKIFKFGPAGRFAASYGEQGQGPGEFMGNPRSAPLKMSLGNDGKFYVYDPGNDRLSMFDSSFRFVRSRKMPFAARVLDSAAVNGQGDIYFVSNVEGRLIHRFDKDLSRKNSFLDAKEHFSFPFRTPARFADSPFVADFHLRKAVMRDGTLVAVSNYALKAFVFDQADRLVRRFMIENRIFIKDFQERLSALATKKDEGWIVPFHLIVDRFDMICLFYANESVRKYEIYKYDKNGTLVCILRFPDAVRPPFGCDEAGAFYACKIEDGEIRISKYIEKKEGGRP